MPQTLQTDRKLGTATDDLLVLSLALALVGCGRSSMGSAATQPPPAPDSAAAPPAAADSATTNSADGLNRDAGPCLLLYNSALVEGDPCCYREGGVNTCDTSTLCNLRSGVGCCLIYAPTILGRGTTCCLFDSSARDRHVDDDAVKECQQLLSQSREP